ncbi:MULTISPECIES: hypothetical protein [unclassified Streptomyces]
MAVAELDELADLVIDGACGLFGTEDPTAETVAETTTSTRRRSGEASK